MKEIFLITATTIATASYKNIGNKNYNNIRIVLVISNNNNNN